MFALVAGLIKLGKNHPSSDHRQTPIYSTLLTYIPMHLSQNRENRICAFVCFISVGVPDCKLLTCFTVLPFISLSLLLHQEEW